MGVPAYIVDHEDQIDPQAAPPSDDGGLRATEVVAVQVRRRVGRQGMDLDKFSHGYLHSFLAAVFFLNSVSS